MRREGNYGLAGDHPDRMSERRLGQCNDGQDCLGRRPFRSDAQRGRVVHRCHYRQQQTRQGLFIRNDWSRRHRCEHCWRCSR